jgi:hypothetical protein
MTPAVQIRGSTDPGGGITVIRAFTWPERTRANDRNPGVGIHAADNARSIREIGARERFRHDSTAVLSI